MNSKFKIQDILNKQNSVIARSEERTMWQSLTKKRFFFSITVIFPLFNCLLLTIQHDDNRFLPR